MLTGVAWFNANAYEFFCSVEQVLRTELKIETAQEFDDDQRRRVTQIIEENDEVQFWWSVVSPDMNSIVAERIMGALIDKYVTIRSFSFASSIMEIYKVETKQGLQKAKRLRHSVPQK